MVRNKNRWARTVTCTIISSISLMYISLYKTESPCDFSLTCVTFHTRLSSFHGRFSLPVGFRGRRSIHEILFQKNCNLKVVWKKQTRPTIKKIGPFENTHLSFFTPRVKLKFVNIQCLSSSLSLQKCFRIWTCSHQGRIVTCFAMEWAAYSDWVRLLRGYKSY